MHQAKTAALDEELVAAAKSIRVLKALAWPVGAEEIFLQGWRKGNPRLPEVPRARPDVRNDVARLDSIAGRCDEEDPAQRFLAVTARSYADAGRMVGAVGTPEFTRHSIRVYGRPDFVYKLQGLTAVDAARNFLEVTDRLVGNFDIEPTIPDIDSETFARLLRREVDAFFHEDTVEVRVDPDMASKALAGAKRVRLRQGAKFSQLDKDQLLQHEAFVHAATQLNGRKQQNLRALGLGAPRTTRTQEGLAVMSELVTDAMDITRLRRVALRVIAVKMALDGADFLDVFRYFLEAGQSEEESVRSTQRIFRGGDVQGGIVFTKDSVYLQGLFEVHTYMRVAIRENRPGLIRHLFAGRLTFGDVLRLDPLFETGWLKPPVYMPTWAADLRRLSALMVYSAFASKIDVGRVHLDRAMEIEEELSGSEP